MGWQQRGMDVQYGRRRSVEEGRPQDLVKMERNHQIWPKLPQQF